MYLRTRTRTYTRVRVARQDTYAEIGRNSAGVSRHQYIIEIYKFSSTPANASARAYTDRRAPARIHGRSGCSGSAAPLKRRARGRATTISAVLTGEIFKRPSLILPPSRVEHRPYSTLRASLALLGSRTSLASITGAVHAK